MENYGGNFRNLRKERGFTLKSVSENIISYSYLSKFENGKSDITLSNFTRLLERLNITLDEFLYFNEAQIPSYIQLLNKLVKPYAENNIKELMKYYDEERDLYQQTNISYHNYNRIMIAALIKDLDSNFKIDQVDINFYVDYLFNCSYWSTYEVSLFGNALFLFTEESLLLLVNEVKIRLNEYKVAQRNIRDLISLIENACLILLRKKNVEKAKELSVFLESHLSSKHYFEKTRKLFIDGIILIGEEKIAEGVQKAQEAINVMHSIDRRFALNHEKELKFFVEK
jgi:Rgg/GadR/MutR family transcriptional activator